MLLADVFEAFRDVCIRNYRLDPSHYISAPQLSWDAMLYRTGCTLSLIDDPAMFKMLDANLRGGVSMISTRYARANNKYLGKIFDPNKQSSYIMYLDANNLYGWAMSQPMPEGDFCWVHEDEWQTIEWMALTEEQQFGYFVECDMDYPAALHDLHNDYPLAPERMAIESSMLSESQVAVRRNYSMSHSSGSCKLVPNLLGKQKYCVHYLNLQFYLKHGMQITKIHRVLKFRQSRWLQPYIQQNQQLRANAKNEFEKDFFKLMNNSVYGKTCENLKKRTDIKLVTSKREAKPLTEKPHCMGYRIFLEDLIGIQMRKVQVLINKPFYVGFSVLELAKLHMYRFHYEYIVPKYGEKASLLFTDTDSLMYEIQTEDAYEDFWKDRQLFDLASYPRVSKFYDPTNNKVLYPSIRVFSFSSHPINSQMNPTCRSECFLVGHWKIQR